MSRAQYCDHIEGKVVLAVHGEPAYPNLPNTASFWHITFYVEGYRLSLTANADTDEIAFAVEESAALPDLTPPPALQDLVGHTFGWLWNATNSQGYSDLLLLAFGGEATGGALTPQLVFVVASSAIH